MNKLLSAGLLSLGLLLSACGSSTTIVDSAKPTLTIGNIDNTTGKVSIAVTPVKNASVKSVAFYDNGNLVTTDTTAPYSADVVYTAANNGSHVIKAVVTDINNVVTEVSKTITVGVTGSTGTTTDTTLPTVTLANISPTTVTSTATITLSATATDNVAVKQVAFYDNDKLIGTASTTAPYTASLSYTAADNGTHVIRAVATDTSGNIGTSANQTLTVAVSADSTKPTVQVVVPGAVVSAGTVTVSATAADNAAIKQVDFYDNGKLVGTDTSSPYSVPVSYTAADNNTHTIKAIATDTSGNTAESTGTFNVSIPTASADTTKPTVTLSLSPATINSNAWTSVTLSGTAQDNVALKNVELALSVGGQTYQLGSVIPDSTGAFSFAITPTMLGPQGNVLLAGLNSVTMTAVAVDSAGNRSDLAAQTLTITH